MTEGEDTEQGLSLTSPSDWQAPATSPWRGRISALAGQRRQDRVGREHVKLVGSGAGDRADTEFR